MDENELHRHIRPLASATVLAVVGTLGALITVRTQPVWPQVVMGVAVLIVVVLVWRGARHLATLRLSAAVALMPVLWQCWTLWQGRWTTSVWLVLAAVALIAILVLIYVPTGRSAAYGGEADRPVAMIAFGAVVVVSLGVTFAGSAAGRATAEVSEPASTPLPFSQDRDEPGAHAYRWSSRADTGPLATAHGIVRLDGDSASRVIATAQRYDSTALWSYELRPYQIAHMATSSSGEVLMLQLRLPMEGATRTEVDDRVTRVWLDAATGEVLDTARWSESLTPTDSGEDAARAATERDWVIYQPHGLDRVTYQDVLVGRYRMDTAVTVALAFEPGQPQQVAWVRERPERCAEHVLWSTTLGDWTLAADADTVAVARGCVVELNQDGVAQVAVSVHGVDIATGQDEWMIEGPQAISLEGWAEGSPATDADILELAVGRMPLGANVVQTVEVDYGDGPTEPVGLSFFWGGGVDEPQVIVDLATGR